MPCQHAEDVCQHCLKKVQTEEEPHCLKKVQTEEAPQISPAKKSPPGKTIGEKRNKILFDSALLAAVGYTAYYNVKLFLGIFDFGVSIVKDLLETIVTR